MTSIKVLNVDDYEPGLYARTKILQQAGFEVVEAQSGKDTLDMVRREKPHIVLLDVHLPDIDGREVCRRIKSDPATESVQIVHITSSFPDAPDRALALDLGADGYLVEPVEPEVIVATVRSLARTRRAEEAVRTAARQWQATFDALSDAVTVLDRDGLVVRRNGAFAALFGGDVSDVREGALASLVRASGHHTEEIRLGERWYRGVSDPVLGGDGAIEGRVCVLSDITELKRAEQVQAELLEREQAARAEAETANRAKDEFLAILSHELRTPLTAILGWARILRSGALPPESVQRAVEVIDRNTRLQARIIEDLLDVSRIVSGKLKLDLRQVDVERLVVGAIEALREPAQAKDVVVEVAVAADVPRLTADVNRLEQIVSNLVSNAIKFTPRGGKVHVDVTVKDGQVAIAVADTGQGIAPEFLPHLFERFRQAETSSRRGHGGLGLGLAIVQHLATMHAGSVRAESPGVDCGSTFTVMLPVLEPSAAGVAGAEAPRASRAMALRRLDGVAVLVVDDEPDALELLRTVLEQSGATVIEAQSVAEALEALDRASPDVIVSDVGMPGEDGYDLMRAVRARAPDRGGDRPAIAVTAYAGSADFHQALDAGYQRHLAKPVDPILLVSVVADLVESTDRAPQ